MQSSLIKFIILTRIIKQKQNILLLSRIKCKKIVKQKRIVGRHLNHKKLNNIYIYIYIYGGVLIMIFFCGKSGGI